MWIAAVALTAVAAADAPDFDAFFKDFAQKRDHIESLEARFTQDSISPDDQYRSTGLLRYVKPRRMMFHYDDPELIYIIDVLRVYEYDPFLEQVQTFDLAEEPDTDAFFVAFDSDTKRLRKAYDVAFIDAGDVDGAAIGLQLTPTLLPDDGANEKYVYFEWARLYLREKDYLPVRIQIHNEEDNDTILRLDGYRINVLDDPHAVQVNLPEGTTIVEDEVIIETVGPEGKWIPRPVEVISVPVAPPSADAQEAPAAGCPSGSEGRP